MGKFDRIVAALEALPEQRREEIAAVLESLFFGDVHPDEYALSEAQVADLRARLEELGPIAPDAEVEAFFAESGR